MEGPLLSTFLFPWTTGGPYLTVFCFWWRFRLGCRLGRWRFAKSSIRRSLRRWRLLRGRGHLHSRPDIRYEILLIWRALWLVAQPFKINTGMSSRNINLYFTKEIENGCFTRIRLQSGRYYSQAQSGSSNTQAVNTSSVLSTQAKPGKSTSLHT